MPQQPIPRVKGTRDFYPQDWAYHKWLCEKLLSVGDLFGYREYESTILEYIDLYLGKSSEEIVTQQTFVLKDRDDNQLVLRPELTPSLARMVADRESELTYPIRWQSYGQFFRYERPQRGRGRAFFQWNVDLLGSDSFLADAEIITIACTMFQRLALTPEHAVIKINDRQALETALIQRLGLDEKSVRPLFGAIDRMDKMPPDQFRAYLSEAMALSAMQIDDLYELLNHSDLSFSPWLQHVFDHLDKNGVADYVSHDMKIVRGFDYYTRTVFEAWAKTSLRRALFGGGRYDNLTLQVGGKRQIPGVGFAVGDMAMTELLKEVGLYPDLPMPGAMVLVTVFSEDLLPESVAFARQLREAGVFAEIHLQPGQRLDRQFKYADRQQIPFAIVIGPDEVQNSTVICKNLKNRTQNSLSRNNINEILDMLKKDSVAS